MIVLRNDQKASYNLGPEYFPKLPTLNLLYSVISNKLNHELLEDVRAVPDNLQQQMSELLSNFEQGNGHSVNVHGIEWWLETCGYYSSMFVIQFMGSGNTSHKIFTTSEAPTNQMIIDNRQLISEENLKAMLNRSSELAGRDVSTYLRTNKSLVISSYEPDLIVLSVSEVLKVM